MIWLTNNLVMVADDHCYTVGNPREDRGSAIEVRNPTYYATAAQAVQGALNRAIRSAVKDGNIDTLPIKADHRIAEAYTVTRYKPVKEV